MYSLLIKPEADKIFRKLAKKNLQQMKIIDKMLQKICDSPFGYKFLRKPLHGFNRAHIDSHFVLIFKIDHVSKVVDVYYFAHHDSAYLWRPKG